MKRSKKLNTTYLLGLKFLLIISLNSAYATSFIDFKIVDKKIEEGQYKEACIQLEKIIFESKDDSIIASALIKKVQCYKSLGRYNYIYPDLERANTKQLSDSMVSLINFEKSLGCYLDKKYDLCSKTLLANFNLNTTASIEQASVFLYCLANNEMGQWTNSKIVLKDYINRSTFKDKDSLLQYAEEIYDGQSLPRLKVLKKARARSFILPGAGQIYAGNTSRGIISFGLFAGSGIFTYFNLIKELYISTLAGAYLIETFYIGNINMLNAMVERKNRALRSSTNEIIKRRLSVLQHQIKTQ